MGLSKEEQEQLDALTRKSKEPDRPAGNINFTLDLSSDSAWERAKSLGLVSDPAPPSNGDSDSDDDDADDPPRRRSGGAGRWAGAGN